jgi:hypothetical protein
MKIEELIRLTKQVKDQGLIITRVIDNPEFNNPEVTFAIDPNTFFIQRIEGGKNTKLFLQLCRAICDLLQVRLVLGKTFELGEGFNAYQADLSSAKNAVDHFFQVITQHVLTAPPGSTCEIISSGQSLFKCHMSIRPGASLLLTYFKTPDAETLHHFIEALNLFCKLQILTFEHTDAVPEEIIKGVKPILYTTGTLQ